ncbi:MAG: pyruvate ferredoxin oxidoreductase [Spirochaetota bacterium]
MNNKIAMTGDETAAYAMKQIEPDVVAAYPITPQTEIVMNYSQYVADGAVKTEMIPVESEHSAMSACVGAAASGARAMTATAANGLALMWEVVYIAASTRLPIVMAIVNRALSAPINIHCDHSDSMGARDSGWIQIYSENNQEVYENMILAPRIAEHPDILLPVMVCQDGFITSHAVEAVATYEDHKVKDFLGTYQPSGTLLDTDRPLTYGPLDLQDYYFEHKRQQSEAMFNALKKIPDVLAEYEKAFGKKMDFVEKYRMEDAEVAVVVLSSAAGTTRTVVDQLRQKGIKAGLLKPRFFRPFPARSIIEALSPVKAAAVLDRAESFSTMGGPLFNEIRSAFYEQDQKPLMANYIYGLGGRETYPYHINSVFEDLLNMAKTGNVENKINYLGVRE